MNFKSKAKNDVHILYLEGNLIASSDGIKILETVDTQTAGGCNKFVVDLSDLKYLNSTGLSILITILTKVRKAGGEVVVINIPDNVKQLLIITKLNTIFIMAENLDKAMELLSGKNT